MTLRRILTGLLLAGAVSPCSGAPTQTPEVVLGQPIQHTAAALDLSLQSADSSTVSRTLGEVLGGTVQVVATGNPTPSVTLDLHAVSPRSALDAVAKVLHGDWRPVYSITAGPPPAGARRPRPLGRTITVNLEGIAARAALPLVARAGGGSVEVTGDLSKSVTLAAREMPVEQALDELVRQVGASWSVTYLITPGLAPPPPGSAPAAGPAREPGRAANPNLQRGTNRGVVGRLRPDAAPEGAPFNDPRFFPMPFAPRQQGTPGAPGGQANAAGVLAEGLTRVMQMPPAQRRGAIKDFALQIDQQFRQIQSLPATRRSEQLMAMQPLLLAATRTYSALTPAQRGEFQPVMDVFNRWMR